MHDKEDRDHIPVLINEALKFLDLSHGGTYLDGTIGSAGHSLCIAEKIGSKGHIIGIDQDPAHLELARAKLEAAKEQMSAAGKAGLPKITLIHGNFADMGSLLNAQLGNIQLDGVLLDLGIHSLHVDMPERGFSFKGDGPLDMRFDPATQTKTAAHFLNQSSYDELVFIFQNYGEERYAHRIAKGITERRKQKPWRGTAELADFIAELVFGKKFSGHPKKHFSRNHPATQVFQSLRIAVNNELNALTAGLREAVDLLKEGGRLVIISYHSLEDRIVKNFLRDGAKEDPPRLSVLTKKPVTAGDEERAANQRCRSAKLRAAEKI